MFVLRQELRLLDLCYIKPLLNDNIDLRLKLIIITDDAFSAH